MDDSDIPVLGEALSREVGRHERRFTIEVEVKRLAREFCDAAHRHIRRDRVGQRAVAEDDPLDGLGADVVGVRDLAHEVGVARPAPFGRRRRLPVRAHRAAAPVALPGDHGAPRRAGPPRHCSRRTIQYPVRLEIRAAVLMRRGQDESRQALPSRIFADCAGHAHGGVAIHDAGEVVHHAEPIFIALVCCDCCGDVRAGGLAVGQAVIRSHPTRYGAQTAGREAPRGPDRLLLLVRRAPF
mmetsp:Transcript_23852/g.67103  ORF Transcript_23852/g.67103 Transcript_23852/m.67103 type:complete len:240 (+) Transcript_23852:2140-2859(+)